MDAWPKRLIELGSSTYILAIPFGPITPAANRYYIAYPEANAELAKVRKFTQWLLDEVEADRAAGRLTVKESV